MLTLRQEDKDLFWQMTSEEENVYDAVTMTAELLSELGSDGAATIGVVLLELLLNAVQHGNRSQADRQVTAAVEYRPGGLLAITVEDEGNGFAYTNVNMSLPDAPGRIYDRHHGYALIGASTARLEFTHPGNRVTAYVDLTKSGHKATDNACQVTHTGASPQCTVTVTSSCHSGVQ